MHTCSVWRQVESDFTVGHRDVGWSRAGRVKMANLHYAREYTVCVCNVVQYFCIIVYLVGLFRIVVFISVHTYPLQFAK